MVDDAFAGKAEVVECPKCWPRCSSSNYVQGGRWCRACSPEPRELSLARFAQAAIAALDDLERTDSETCAYVKAVRVAIARHLEEK